MALDIGRLVGFIDLDASGAVKGVKQTEAAIAQGGQRWSKAAGDAGDKAGKSAGSRLTSGMLTALKPLAAGIVERNAAGVDLAPRRLPGNQDAGTAARLQHRARA